MKQLFFSLSLLLMACANSTKNIPTIANFDTDKYLGKWYEIARYDHRFERGLNYVSATYSKKQDGKLSVLNEGVKEDSSQSSIIGKAYLKETKNNLAELRVSFFWVFYAKYRIIYLDEAYENAIVTGANKNYLWILSRKPIIDETTKTNLLNFCVESGFDTTKLIFPLQKELKK